MDYVQSDTETEKQASISPSYRRTSVNRDDLLLDKRRWRPSLLSYYQLIQLVSQSVHDSSIARLTMLDQCCQYFSPSACHLKTIYQFALNYRSTKAAHWYTKDCFIHRVVNEALRKGHIEFCGLLRYFIAALSDQLNQMKLEQQNRSMNGEERVRLYRGLRQSEEHLSVLKDFVGHQILTKGFMSTTRDLGVALVYAGASHSQSLQSQPLVLEIDVDLQAPDIVAVDISHLSNFPDEKEVLFDFGSQFYVDSLTYDASNSIWHCRLIAVSINSIFCQAHSHYSSKELSTTMRVYQEEESKLEEIMRRERRRKFVSELTRDEDEELWSRVPSISWIASNTIDRARILQQKALMHWQRSRDMRRSRAECKIALSVLESQECSDFSADADKACSLNNLAFAYYHLGQPAYAIRLLKQSVEIRQRIGSSAHFLAQSLRNLGLAYTYIGDHRNASHALEQAVLISEKAPKTTQWTTAITLRNLAEFYHNCGRYKEANQSLHQALERLEECNTAIAQCLAKKKTSRISSNRAKREFDDDQLSDRENGEVLLQAS